jgi:hypothetical protein
MKIKLINNVSVEGEPHFEGQVIVVDDQIAARMIVLGNAIPVDGTVKQDGLLNSMSESVVIETAEKVIESETADADSKKKKK